MRVLHMGVQNGNVIVEHLPEFLGVYSTYYPSNTLEDGQRNGQASCV
jgi:hypothetical protein